MKKERIEIINFDQFCLNKKFNKKLNFLYDTCSELITDDKQIENK